MKAFGKYWVRNAAAAAGGLAVVAATAALFQHTQSFQSLYLSGRKHYDERHYSKALFELLAAHARNPADENTSRYLVLTYQKLDRPEQAAAILAGMAVKGLPAPESSAIPARPAPEELGAKVSDARSAGDGGQAGGSSSRGAALSPQGSPARNPEVAGLSASHGVAGGNPFREHPGQGVREIDLRKAISMSEQAGHPEGTLMPFERLMALRPDDVRLKVAAARNYSWAGRYDRSLQLYAEAIRRGADDDGTRGDYAEVLFWAHRYEESAAQFRLASARSSLRKKQALSYGLTLMAIGRHPEALFVLDGLARKYPDDPDVLMAATDACVASGQFDRAEALCREMSLRNPGDPRPLNRLSDIAIARQRFPQALIMSREVLRRFPDNRYALLNVARVSSWQRDYRTSFDAYDHLIAGASRRDALTYSREKARVLIWKQDFGASMRLYNETLAAYPDNAALRAEVAAEKDYYRSAYRSAERSLKEWLQADTDNPEALFELGQIYMQHGRWRQAADTYDRLLAAVPDHRDAQAARKGIDVLSSMTRFTGGVDHFRSKSVDRLTDVEFTDVRSSLIHPLREGLSVTARQDTKSYRFESNPMKPTTVGVMAGIEYNRMPDMLLRAAYGRSWKPDDHGQAWNGFVEAESTPVDNLHLSTSYRREEVVENPQTYLDNLHKDSWQSRASFDGSRRWSASVDFTHDGYSDGNRRFMAGGTLKVNLLYDPRCLSLVYRIQDYGFSRNSPDYFSPSSFTTNTLGVEWKHDLNSKESFRGGRAAWYTAAWRVSAETDGNYSQQLHAGVYREWSNRLSTSLEWQRTWSSHREVYNDRWMSAQVNWFIR